MSLSLLDHCLAQLAFFQLEVERTVENQYIPFADMDENSKQRGWSDLVSSLEEHFASESGMTHGTAEGSHRNLAHHPAIAASIGNITRLLTEDDYPLWGVHCKVTPILHPQRCLILMICPGRFGGRDGFFFTADGLPTARDTIRLY